jgi:hypothetical protein
MSRTTIVLSAYGVVMVTSKAIWPAGMVLPEPRVTIIGSSSLGPSR